MKKGFIGLAITSAILFCVGVALFLLIPTITGGFDLKAVYEGVYQQIQIEFNFGVESPTRIIFLSILSVAAVLFITQLVLFICGKRPADVIFSIYVLLFGVTGAAAFLWPSDVTLSYSGAKAALEASGHGMYIYLLWTVLAISAVFFIIAYFLDFAVSIKSIKNHKHAKEITPVEPEVALVKEQPIENINQIHEVAASNVPEQSIVTPVAEERKPEPAPVVTPEIKVEPIPVIEPVTPIIIMSNQPSEEVKVAAPVVAPLPVEPKHEEKETPVVEAVKDHRDPLMKDILNIMNQEVGGIDEPIEEEKININISAIPTLVQVGPSLEEIRSVIKEENNNKPIQANVDAELIRLIVREELEKLQPVAAPVSNVAPEVAPIEEKPLVAPIPEPIPAVKPIIVTTTGPRAKEEKVETTANKIIRIPFQTRMKNAEKEMRTNYTILKQEIMSYGVKSRVSNSGDTFRLHTKTYVKLTIAGKSLKLYFALNPKDYENSKLPILDAGAKGIYKEIPLVFKVKSELSVRRAKQLIADVMEKGELEQGKIPEINYAKELDEMIVGKEDEE